MVGNARTIRPSISISFFASPINLDRSYPQLVNLAYRIVTGRGLRIERLWLTRPSRLMRQRKNIRYMWEDLMNERTRTSPEQQVTATREGSSVIVAL